MAVSLKPSDARTSSEITAYMPIVDVIRLRAEAEKHRTKDSPDPKVIFDCDKSITCVTSALHVIQRSLTDGRTNKDVVSQSLSHKAIVLVTDIDDLIQINKKTVELEAMQGEKGGMQDIIDMVGMSVSCYGETLYQKKRWTISIPESNIKCLSGLLIGTGMSLYEMVSFSFLLVLSSDEDPRISGYIKDAKIYAKTYLQFLKERRNIVDAYYVNAVSRLVQI